MLSVIIVNYKNEDLTVSFVLKQLSKITMQYNVVISNNGADKESDKRLAEPLNATIVYDKNSRIDNKRKVYILHNEENLGFARGNNLAAEFCRKNFNSSFILFTNNDIEFLDNDVVESLVKKIQEIEKAAIIGPKVIGIDGRLQSPEPYESFTKKFIYPYVEPFLFWRSKDESKNKYSETAKEGFHYRVMGSFFLCNAEDFFSCGMMDSGTFLYFEECILSERILRIGKGVYYYPNSSVLHVHNQTIGKYASFKRQRDLMFDSGVYYFRKYKNVSILLVCIAWLAKELSKIVGTVRRRL